MVRQVGPAPVAFAAVDAKVEGFRPLAAVGSLASTSNQIARAIRSMEWRRSAPWARPARDGARAELVAGMARSCIDRFDRERR
jgi:hypothetical protein